MTAWIKEEFLVDMGRYKEERYVGSDQLEKQQIVKNSFNCMWLFCVSIAGGLVLGWWEHEYHPTNSHQWMVPLGLILFITPVLIWLAVFTSEMWNSDVLTNVTPPVPPPRCGSSSSDDQ
ncbi:hypothetical protein HS088_TW08G00472 [Tripterygium wilfordii]|uniref:Transmembrane protein n=1 Tax=Tripterygium wilfordii TaxID=458696 RepID=A0A7J7DC61_TRIWF|nr:hypothetical protein HS088_TW08G00472 [Tripterygium wilfordii]